MVIESTAGNIHQVTSFVRPGPLKYANPLVMVTGDFGRTPKINGNNGGRDHWNYCYTIMLAGGGMKAGHIHGASDRTGAFPADRPTSPGNVLATIYRLLGIDHRQELFDNLGRPHRIVPRGDVMEELIA